MAEPVERITIDDTPYTEDELSQLLGLDSIANFNEIELEALLSQANKSANRQLSEFIAANLIASALILARNRRPGVFYFKPNEQYYRGRSPVPQQRIDNLVNIHRRTTSQRTLRHGRDLLARRITLGQYHERMTRDIAQGHIRMMELGAGGRRQLTRRHWERLQDQLYGDGPGAGDLRRLQRHVDRIRSGELTEAQLRDRSRRYGTHVGVSYNGARWENLLAEADLWEARRGLGANKNHCVDCPGYDTGGAMVTC